MTTAPSLLAVFAHPDDESLACGGLLAWCAQRGVRVSLLCLTRGEHGPGGPPDQLGEMRARELRDAVRVIGIHDATLLSHQDGMLPWIAASLIEADIRETIVRVAPNVVVTFDEDGLYGHPDHVAVHERTTAAVDGLGKGGPALFYASMPRGAMRALVDAAPRGHADPLGMVFGIDSDAFGAMAPPPTVVLDVRHVASTKLRALRCHRTQVAGTVVDSLRADDAARVLGREHYRRAAVGAAGLTFVDALAGDAPATEPR
ncbi:MAG: PIG-L deacetylase family protein [Longimicrobiales bacterium]